MQKHDANGPDELMTRWSLIRRLTKEDCDEQSWQEFYEIYQHLIYAVARKTGLNHQTAQDIVQETMRAVCENIRDFVPDPGRGSFKSWLLQMARWRILDQHRKRARDGQSTSEATPDETQRTATVERITDPRSLDFENVWAEAWRKELFEAAVHRVKQEASPEQFQIFDFYVLQKMPVAKVTRSLGVNLGQVYLARHRVMKLIKKEIKSLEKKMK